MAERERIIPKRQELHSQPDSRDLQIQKFMSELRLHFVICNKNVTESYSIYPVGLAFFT